MSVLDTRTRTAAEIRDVDVRSFFSEELPALAADRAERALPAARHYEVVPLSVMTPSGTWTLHADAHAIAIDSGDSGYAAVSFDDDEVGKLVNDLITPTSLMTAGRLRVERGHLGHVVDWWLLLRALIDDRDAYIPRSVSLVDGAGAPLDLTRAFGLDSDDDEIASFLREAGFLHLAGWFDVDEMDAVSAEMDAAFPTYTPDDGKSWWATTASGAQRAVRLQQFVGKSPTLARLLADDRFLRIGRLTDDGYLPGADAEALVKPLGVVSGISDLPWHKDCSLGMHSYNCCGLIVGISVTGADAESGQLAVVPGSHRALLQPAVFRHDWELPALDLPTHTGDVTVHCSCTLHMSYPPTRRERRVVYAGFSLPPKGEPLTAHLAATREVRENSYKKVSQPPSPVA
jgi:Phytanoyl-CoA dioxygenase (PhyH)